MSSRTNHSPEQQRLGDFEIGRELGRGGMGVVYDARQVSLNRTVALKVLSGGLGLTANAVQRFRREAEAAAKLHHTNIVPVYATGEENGVHYYAMELIDGPSLDQVVHQRRLAPTGTTTQPTGSYHGNFDPAQLTKTGPYVESSATSNTGTALSTSAGLNSSMLDSGSGYFDTVARMIAEVADGLEYAHQQGVIHRDIKPSNLLLAPAGRLSINDFGLARVLEQPGMTTTGEFVGTPAYMSPEQIAAGRTPLDHRTDIYSLGATLYELLTLQPPFRGERRDQVLAQIIHKEPQPPRKINKKVPVDLETICLKALEKDPDRRYQTAGQMAEDLRRYVNRFAIAARRAGPIERLRKWGKRHPGLAVALAGMMVAIAVAGLFAYQAWSDRQAHIVAEKESQQQLRAEKQQNALEKALAVAMSGDLDAAEKAIGEAELLGASAGKVRMLRGQVAFHRGEVMLAIEHLQLAVKLEKESVAAWSMLALFSLHGGPYEEYEEILEKLERLRPSTPEDYLFKGYAESALDPVQGLRTMDQAISRRNSPIARAMRAEVWTSRAVDTADPRHVAAMLNDVRAAKGLLPDNPYVLYVSVNAHLVAANVFAETGDKKEQQRALDEAGRDAHALEGKDTLLGAVMIRYVYFTHIGAEDKGFDVLRKAAERVNSTLILGVLSTDSYRRGEPAKALELLDRRKQPELFGDIVRAYVLAELPNGPARALEAYREMAKRYTQGSAPLYCHAVPLFLQRQEEVVAASRDLLNRDHRLPPLRSNFHKNWLAFNAGQLSAADFEKAAGASRWEQCGTHHAIGVMRLAGGDRAGAKAHFRKSVATHCLNFSFHYDCSRFFLERMEKDPTWPPWIKPEK